MHFRDWTHPITLETPIPVAPSPTDRKKRFRMEIEDDEDDMFDDMEETHPSIAEPTPTVSASLTSPPSTSTVPPPPVSVPSTSPMGARLSKASEVATILPILAVPPNQKMSLQTLFPLLQDTFLGMLNHVVQLQNQSVASVFRALGQDPPPPFPTFPHPYHSSTPPTQPPRVRFSDPPVIPSSAPAASVPFTTPFVTPEMLLASLSATAVQTTATTEPVLEAVTQLVSGIASTSGAHDDSESEDEVIVLEDQPSVSATTAPTTDPETPAPERTASPSHPTSD